MAFCKDFFYYRSVAALADEEADAFEVLAVVAAAFGPKNLT
jgi:hypothetical protein